LTALDRTWTRPRPGQEAWQAEAAPPAPVVSPLAVSKRPLKPGHRRTLPVFGVVVHTTGRGPAVTGKKQGRPPIQVALDVYSGQPEDAHYVIDYDGTIHAIVPENRVSWHPGWGGVGRRRWASWTAPTWWSSVWGRWNARTPADLLPPGANDPNQIYIGVELLGNETASGFTSAQYDALARLVVDVARRHGFAIHAAPSPRLLGHEDVEPIRRSNRYGGWDPGAHRTRPVFSWSGLWSRMQAIGGGAGGPHRNPPDTAGCGVPERPSAELEAELDLELEMLGEIRHRAAPVVRPALSLFMNSTKTSHRNHFECQASRIARMISAYADPRADRCTPRRIGPTAYDTGADIIAAINAAHSCLERRIAKLHIVGHSGSYGVFGATPGANGIYLEVDAADRATGARAVTDIPVATLANDVVVVLHGCNQGAGSDSFAERLYRHLAATLTSPVVFAHPNTGCAGRDNSWRRFDARTPGGRAVRSIVPHYSGGGCCTPARRRARRPPGAPRPLSSLQIKEDARSTA
jgi:hypothetical protein